MENMAQSSPRLPHFYQMNSSCWITEVFVNFYVFSGERIVLSAELLATLPGGDIPGSLVLSDCHPSENLS